MRPVFALTFCVVASNGQRLLPAFQGHVYQPSTTPTDLDSELGPLPKREKRPETILNTTKIPDDGFGEADKINELAHKHTDQLRRYSAAAKQLINEADRANVCYERYSKLDDLTIQNPSLIKDCHEYYSNVNRLLEELRRIGNEPDFPDKQRLLDERLPTVMDDGMDQEDEPTKELWKLLKATRTFKDQASNVEQQANRLGTYRNQCNDLEKYIFDAGVCLNGAVKQIQEGEFESVEEILKISKACNGGYNQVQSQKEKMQRTAKESGFPTEAVPFFRLPVWTENGLERNSDPKTQLLFQSLERVQTLYEDVVEVQKLGPRLEVIRSSINQTILNNVDKVGQIVLLSKAENNETAESSIKAAKDVVTEYINSVRQDYEDIASSILQNEPKGQ